MSGAASLTRASLARGVRVLATRDRDLAAVVERHGPPPMWARRPGFATLVRMILEQQVSLASARAAYERLSRACAPVTPRRLLTLDDAALRAAGFSRQKTAYARDLAERVVDRRLPLRQLASRDDDGVRAALTSVKGIGDWTVDVYLLMALRRADAWPVGDLALAKSARRVKGLGGLPTGEDLADLGERWRPWRAVAARLLWHAYLCEWR